ncbi:MAG: glycerol-3-phosphate 1-O-acyltransferase PlsY [Bacteroidetes bacterium]|nr:glycerol-3-phosphate 1-O-acyltransferase PlsY [Bacteroidota bacterium]
MNTVLVNMFLSYLIGSIPTSIILSKFFAGIDIREHGSGNAGGTNVFRVLGWKFGLVVMVVDILKGTAATLYISQFQFFGLPNIEIFQIKILCGVSAILGHVWTIFAKFRGGKGVATGIGMMIALSPIDITMAILVFILIIKITKYVSLGSMIGISIVPISIFIRKNLLNHSIEGFNFLIWTTIAMSLFIIFTHRSNIKRLMNGNENKISFRKK